MSLASQKGLLSTIAGGIVVLLLFYHQPLLHPNSYFFGGSGDGIKNYYTYAHYVEHNAALINFEGLNYPYGEHFLYTDCHPILAVSLRAVSSVFPGVSRYAVGIVNLLMLLSLVVTAVVLYKLLTRLKVSTWFAVGGALGIMLLSPQVFRMTGHYALSYSCFLPLTYYLLLRQHEAQHKAKWAILMVLNLLLWFSVHAYLGTIAAAIVGLFFVVQFVLRHSNWRITLSGLGQAALPVAMFRLFVVLTDPHTNRTTNPYGFFEFHAEAETVFLPIAGPGTDLVRAIVPYMLQTWEGWAYIGMVSGVALAVLGLRYSLQVVKTRTLKFQWDLFDNRFLIALLVASTIILSCSMGYPFRGPFEKGVDLLPVLKQFRSIGRFAWVFYFTSGIVAVYLADAYAIQLRTNGRYRLAGLLCLAVPVLFAAESLPYHLPNSKQLIKVGNAFQEDLDFSAIDLAQYQAIIPLPYYYIGSENFGINGTQASYLASMTVSYQTGLPICASYLTRTSICDSKKMMQMLAPPFYEKTLAADLPSNKKMLVVYTKEDLSTYEKQLLDRATSVHEYRDFVLAEISLEQLFTRSNIEDEAAQSATARQALANPGVFCTSDSTSWFHFNGFEEHSTTLRHIGNGALSLIKNDRNMLAQFAVAQFNSNQQYTASFWMYNDGENCGQDVSTCNASIEYISNSGADTVLLAIVNPRTSHVIDGQWSLVELTFSVPHSEGQIQLLLEGTNRENMEIVVDDVFVAPVGLQVYRFHQDENNPQLIRNNHVIRPIKP